MNKTNELVTTQLGNLIKEGTALVALASRASGGFSGIEIVMLSKWVTKCGQMIKSLCPKDSVYIDNFSKALDNKSFYNVHSEHYTHLGVVLGCITAVNEDYKSGLLNNIQNLLRAEIFGDFLEMAQYLLNEGYKDAAAVLAGAVLEDSLRKIANTNGVPVDKPDGSPKTMEPLNQDIYKAGVYDKLIQKQITSWGELRNKAAHGNFDKYDSEQVNMMLLFVEKFCSDYIS